MNIPHHIAFIPDGNRRWAKKRFLPTLAGHKKGFDRTRDIIVYANEIGVKTITFYAFSTENWNRAKDEVDYLMDLFVTFFDQYMEKFNKLGIKLRHIGDINKLPKECAKKLLAGMEMTKNNDGMVVQLAINYGGRDEILRAVKSIVAKKVDAEKITEEMIDQHLDTNGLGDPDLIIRTSGEERLSGFLLWQSAYSELYFPKTLWPDFTKKELDKSIEIYNDRQRRFGK